MIFIEFFAYFLGTIAFVAVVTIIPLIRAKYSTRVRCWFCNSSHKVEYENRNSWDCPSCEQYNGFTADGDYNKPIPAQHDELMNNAVPLKKKQLTPANNGLCSVCNNNQRLKIYQLAVFSPIDESNYDEEVEKYQKQLEKSYRLCPQCDKTVKQTIKKQTSMILGQRLSDFRNRGLSLLDLSLNPVRFHTAKKSLFRIKTIKFLTIFLAIIQLILIVKKIDFTKTQKTLPKELLPYILILKGILSFALNFLSTIYEYFYYLYFTIFSNSLFAYILKYLQELNLSNVKFFKFYLSAMVNLDKCILIPCMGVITELLVLILGKVERKYVSLRSIAWVANLFISYWRLKGSLSFGHYPELIQIILSCYLIVFTSSNKSYKYLNEKTATTKLINNKNETILNNDISNNHESCSEKSLINSTFKTPENTPKLNISGSTRSVSPISSIYHDTFSSYKPPNESHIFGQKPNFENPLTTTHFKFQSDFRSPCLSDDSFSTHKSIRDQLNNSTDSNRSRDTLNYSFTEIQNKSQTESELGDILNNLHLGTYPNVGKCGLPSAFKINNNIARPKPILSPPRLHNVTQSSWVAGGYWKSPQYNNFNSYTNLSRSSSQSSGFGSQTSSQNLNNDIFHSLPPSCNNSISEFDKNSIYSEPSYHSSAKNSSYQNRIFPTLSDQQIYILPRSQNSSPPHSVLNGICNSNESFRPNSVNSVLSQTVSNKSFNLSQKSLDTLTYNFDKTVSSYNLNNSVIYKPKNNLNGYVKGSLLQKWRNQNEC